MIRPKTPRLSAAAAFGALAAAAMLAAAPAPAQDDDPAAWFPRVNPLSGDAEAIAEGKTLFVNWCSQCHGRKANGNARFEQQAADLRTYNRGYPRFVVTILNGQNGTIGMMPPLGGYLDEDQIARIGAYLETLAIEGAAWALD